jgi:hypothetical protein
VCEARESEVLGRDRIAHSAALDLFTTLDLVHHDAYTGAIFVAHQFSLGRGATPCSSTARIE